MPSILIMAGGTGERFWPVSTPSCPKQYLPLTGNFPLILETVYRVEDLVGLDNIHVITTQAQLPLARQILSMLPKENIIVEPEGRNTAPCLALGVARIKRKLGAEEMVSVLPADHFIRDIAKFKKTLVKALASAAAHHEMVTFGITPDRPETGYGYLALGPRVSSGVYQGIRFEEKPDRATAEHFVSSRSYLWNSGMFVFRVGTFEEKLKDFAPELHKGYLELERASDGLKIAALYSKLPKTSIDYGLMEKLPSFLVVKGDFGWDDLGTWRALETTNPLDKQGNIVRGSAELLEVSDSVIYAGDKLVAAIGVRDLVIVESENAVLVCAKDRVQDVKKIVERLKAKAAEELTSAQVAATKEDIN